MADLKLRDVRKSYGQTEVIKGVDLDILDGEFVVFVGPSGCGKSTLLRLIAGLEDITSGDIEIGGRLVNDVEPRDRGVAMVFQSYALYPHMTVRENVGFGLRLAKVPKAQREQAVGEAARILQMEPLLDRKPAQLSGGQRQRVAIGRAIVRDPDVFLFDEPLSNLDAALRMDMRAELAGLHQQLDSTMIYVTHDQVEAMTLADKIVVLKDGEVQQIGAPMELYEHPANLFVAGFIGAPKMNLLPGKVTAVDGHEAVLSGADLPRLVLPAPEGDKLAAGDEITLGLRPHDLKRMPDGPLELHTDLLERLGHETVVAGHLPTGARLTAVLDGRSPVALDETIRLGFEPSSARLFDAGGRAI
ncbi:ABC transporter ATP-binding protein [Pseudoroseicyclus tamaricis]|uniref:sn-glycerol-3-phosphate ABC transporter ATP-binding protein UgpC n=1 Tax=Pseudoroseicyclus tamaricis TaxID=2705421 RepID=A0A6B2JPH3_9RHOB|nr:sn-glycerol-3-phosphate ABC transporter ATP-binding protein UgpC [Pseudoroseicyclus tamaricis]NDU99844.1 sn-glycerol-3-phosphate ABC transporter ATP-binding protein UgpC [Pseudoroseicyclus tamaricis]